MKRLEFRVAIYLTDELHDGSYGCECSTDDMLRGIKRVVRNLVLDSFTEDFEEKEHEVAIETQLLPGYFVGKKVLWQDFSSSPFDALEDVRSGEKDNGGDK